MTRNVKAHDFFALVLVLSIAFFAARDACALERRATPSSSPTPPPAEAPALATPPPDEVDVTGDKPGAVSDTNTGLLESLKPNGEVSSRAQRCYKLISDMKDNAEKIRKDLAEGAKEITRLIHFSDELCKNIGALANIWPADKDFRDVCVTAKRSALVLNDELSQSPRQFSHVRWAFEAMIQDTFKLRERAKELADLEPKPTATVGKDGKIVYVDPVAPPPDPRTVRHDAIMLKGEEAANRVKKSEDAKKDKDMPIDLDGLPQMDDRKGGRQKQ